MYTSHPPTPLAACRKEGVHDLPPPLAHLHTCAESHAPHLPTAHPAACSKVQHGPGMGKTPTPHTWSMATLTTPSLDPRSRTSYLLDGTVARSRGGGRLCRNLMALDSAVAALTLPEVRESCSDVLAPRASSVGGFFFYHRVRLRARTWEGSPAG